MTKHQAKIEYQKLISKLERKLKSQKISKAELAKSIGYCPYNIYKVFNFKITLPPVYLILAANKAGMKLDFVNPK